MASLSELCLLRSLALALPLQGRPTTTKMLITAKAGFVAAVLPRLSCMARPVLVFASMVAIQYPGRKGDAYNILWILVFGFATLNILGLVGRRFEPERTRLNFGELLAVLVVVFSLGLLGWEALTLLHIFPIQLKPR